MQSFGDVNKLYKFIFEALQSSSSLDELIGFHHKGKPQFSIMISKFYSCIKQIENIMFEKEILLVNLAEVLSCAAKNYFEQAKTQFQISIIYAICKCCIEIALLAIEHKKDPILINRSIKLLDVVLNFSC